MKFDLSKLTTLIVDLCTKYCDVEEVMPRRKKEDELPPDQRTGPPRGAANARERTRMRVLSKAFGRLKLTLPWVPPDTKLSKLDTLR